TTKVGLGVVAALSGVTAMAVIPQTPWGQDLFNLGSDSIAIDADSTVDYVVTDEHGVKILVKQSQTKIGQNADDEVYLDVKLDIPTLTQLSVDKKPTDLVLVLDRSGS